ncbi:hypothetical protein [Marinobacter sp. HL-58]|uniref:hypothetical protein n=1 Tax=Marinobacter sp. HL-58 TaxID=1479237 RepID=UPI0004875A54|nr:hypothetical protein [Marinobacter sp. HL-58]KPP99201.1 MAG: hypothetical protein HLUCCO03_05700 [Marinobacter sp. HL-58]
MKPWGWKSVAAFGSIGLLILTPAAVVADDDMGVTMRMVTDDTNLTESVVREIELREPVALERRDSNAGEPAENAREARQRGREAARTATERAREVRERNEQRGRPELPDRPDPSNRPERPELP